MQRIVALALGLLAFGDASGDAPKCPDDLAACPALAGCWQAPSVLEDTATGYPDACVGLKNAKITDEAGCETACKSDTTCSVWQYSGIGEAANPDGHCYMGNPKTNCRDANRTSFHSNAGQRLQHGDVKVLKTAASGFQVIGLLEYVMHSKETVAMDVARCKQACYSDSTCGVWQFSPVSGCWREHLTTDPAEADFKAQETVVTDSDFAKTVTAGEYIAHYCPAKPPPKEEENNWPYIIAAIVIGLLLLAGILYAVLKPKPKKPKKTRAVKIEKPEEPVVPLFVPQPSVVYTQPSVVYSAPAPTQSVVYTQVQQQPVQYVEQPMQYAAPVQYLEQPVQYMQPTMMAEAVAVQQPLLGGSVIIS